MSIHIFAVPEQPATRWRPPGMRRYVKGKPNALAWCNRCRKRHQLRHMVVRAYYDEVYFYCAEGRPCGRGRP